MTMKLTGAVLGLLLWGTAQAGTVTYVYTDPQGTPLMETDAQGNITARYEYTPYGVPVASMGAAPDGVGYTGHVNDPESGLVYMQQRYYDAEVGRFLSVDPVGPKAGDGFTFNRYEYANGNPIMRVDPDGRKNIYGIVAKFTPNVISPTDADNRVQVAAQKSVDLTVNAVVKNGTDEQKSNTKRWGVEVNSRQEVSDTGGTATTYGSKDHTVYFSSIETLATYKAPVKLAGGITAQGGDPALVAVGAHEIAHTTEENMAIEASPEKERNASQQALRLIKDTPEAKGVYETKSNAEDRQ